MDLTTAKVVITGATSGLGLEMAKALLKEGAKVLISSRNEEKVKRVAQELGTDGFKADVAIEDDIKALIDFASAEWGGFNVLINNAGIGASAELTETSTEDFQRIWEVNTRGLFITGREAARYFKKQKYGNIINIGSSSALKGYATGSTYVASKFAVTGLTECWRAELRPYNVRVMQINPSEVITEFFDKMGYKPKDVDKKLKPTEIAHVAVSMLKMNDIGFITDAAVWATNPW